MEHMTPDLTPGKSFDFGSMPRAIDFLGGSLIVGLRDGTIFHLADYENGEDRKAIMQSHDNGEVWGLADCGDGHVVTCGDDNKVMIWDINNRRLAK